MNRIGGRFGMAQGQGMELSQRPNTPAAKQSPAQPMPSPEVGGNRPGFAQRPGGDATFPQEFGGMGAIRSALDRNRSRR
jgi:hypothetical protein